MGNKNKRLGRGGGNFDLREVVPTDIETFAMWEEYYETMDLTYMLPDARIGSKVVENEGFVIPVHSFFAEDNVYFVAYITARDSSEYSNLTSAAEVVDKFDSEFLKNLPRLSNGFFGNVLSYDDFTVYSSNSTIEKTNDGKYVGSYNISIKGQVLLDLLKDKTEYAVNFVLSDPTYIQYGYDKLKFVYEDMDDMLSSDLKIESMSISQHDIWERSNYSNKPPATWYKPSKNHIVLSISTSKNISTLWYSTFLRLLSRVFACDGALEGCFFNGERFIDAIDYYPDKPNSGDGRWYWRLIHILIDTTEIKSDPNVIKLVTVRNLDKLNGDGSGDTDWLGDNNTPTTFTVVNAESDPKDRILINFDIDRKNYSSLRYPTQLSPSYYKFIVYNTEVERIRFWEESFKSNAGWSISDYDFITNLQKDVVSSIDTDRLSLYVSYNYDNSSKINNEFMLLNLSPGYEANITLPIMNSKNRHIRNLSLDAKYPDCETSQSEITEFTVPLNIRISTDKDTEIVSYYGEKMTKKQINESLFEYTFNTNKTFEYYVLGNTYGWISRSDYKFGFKDDGTYNIVVSSGSGVNLTNYSKSVTIEPDSTHDSVSMYPTFEEPCILITTGSGVSVSCSSPGYYSTSVPQDSTDKKAVVLMTSSPEIRITVNDQFTLETATYNGEDVFAQIKDNTLTLPPINQTVNTLNLWARNNTAVLNVTLGENMTANGGGALSQTVNIGSAITPIIVTANTDYYFPEDYSVAPVNGISVTRDSDRQLTISGTLSGDANITLVGASEDKSDADVYNMIVGAVGDDTLYWDAGYCTSGKNMAGASGKTFGDLTPKYAGGFKIMDLFSYHNDGITYSEGIGPRASGPSRTLIRFDVTNGGDESLNRYVIAKFTINGKEYYSYMEREDEKVDNTLVFETSQGGSIFELRAAEGQIVPVEIYAASEEYGWVIFKDWPQYGAVKLKPGEKLSDKIGTDVTEQTLMTAYGSTCKWVSYNEGFNGGADAIFAPETYTMPATPEIAYIEAQTGVRPRGL